MLPVDNTHPRDRDGVGAAGFSVDSRRLSCRAALARTRGEARQHLRDLGHGRGEMRTHRARGAWVASGF